MHSTVTALLPAWQSADFIQATLDSISAQSYEHLKVIVSVDLCDDGTYDVCAAHAEKDPRFRVVQQTERMGYVGNCNYLLDAADSDYAMLSFHDDILDPDYTMKLVEALDGHPEAVIAYSDLLMTFEKDGEEVELAFTALDGLSEPVRRGMRMLKPVHHSYIPNRGLFRLKQARRINGVKAHAMGEFQVDWPWMFSMSLLGEFVRVPEILCYKYLKTSSMSQVWDSTLAHHAAVRASCIRELKNSDLPHRDKLLLSMVSFFWGSTLPTRIKIAKCRQRWREANTKNRS